MRILRSELVHQSAEETGIGRVTLAGFLHDSPGAGIDRMRVLGSFAIVYLAEGSGSYRDAGGREEKVAAGDAIVVFPDMAHRYGPGPGERWSEFYIVFDGAVFEMWRGAGLLDERRPVCRLEPREYWLRRWVEAVAVRGRRGWEKRSALEMVCRLQRVLGEMVAVRERAGEAEADRGWLARARELLEDAADGGADGVDLAAVARQMGASYERFRKRFSALSGQGPKHYLMETLMQRACEMIFRGGVTNREAAKACGFCDEFHFSRRFKQIVGVSPSEFRSRIPRGK